MKLPGTGRAQPRVLVIVNPYATSVDLRTRESVLRRLGEAFSVESVDTTHQGHATELALQAEGHTELVAVLGGDGTANEVANALAGSQLPMTALPGGSTSVLARLLGFSDDLGASIDALNATAGELQVRRIDLGHVDGRYFTFTSGFGFDASVVRRIDSHPRLKARFRHAFAAYAGVTTALREYAVHPPLISVDADGTELPDCVTAMIQNADTYSFFGSRPLQVAPGAHFSSGTLSGALLLSARPTVVPGISRRLLSPSAHVATHDRVHAFADARVVTMRADRDVPLHVDGDYLGDRREVRFEVVPAALSVAGPRVSPSPE